MSLKMKSGLLRYVIKASHLFKKKKQQQQQKTKNKNKTNKKKISARICVGKYAKAVVVKSHWGKKAVLNPFCMTQL